MPMVQSVAGSRYFFAIVQIFFASDGLHGEVVALCDDLFINVIGIALTNSIAVIKPHHLLVLIRHHILLSVDDIATQQRVPHLHIHQHAKLRHGAHLCHLQVRIRQLVRARDFLVEALGIF